MGPDSEGLVESGGWGERLGKIPRIGGFLIFLIIIALAVVPTVVTTRWARTGIARFSEEAVQYWEDNLPAIRLQGGKAIVDAPQPVIIPKPGQEPPGFGKQFVCIIDTTGGTEKIPREYQSGVLLTEDVLWVKDQQGRLQEISLDQINEVTGDFTLDGPFLRARKDGWIGIAVLVIGGVLLFWNLAIKPIQAILLAALAMIVSPPGAKVPFGAGFKIGAVALVPPVGLQVAQGLAGFDVPFGFLIYVALAVLGTWICARCARPPAPVATEASPGSVTGDPAAGAGNRER